METSAAFPAYVTLNLKRVSKHPPASRSRKSAVAMETSGHEEPQEASPLVCVCACACYIKTALS